MAAAFQAVACNPSIEEVRRAMAGEITMGCDQAGVPVNQERTV